MHYSSSDTIGTIPVGLARAVVRRLNVRPLSPEALADLTRVHDLTPEQCLFELEREEMVERVAGAGDERWRTTAAGASLTLAPFGHPIKRSTADRLLKRVVERAGEYNRTPGFPMSVERLDVYGSYLDPHIDRLGDLDIQVTATLHLESAEQLREYFANSGRTARHWLDYLGWPRAELHTYLKMGSRAVSLRSADEGELTTTMEVVYERSQDSQALDRSAG